MYRPGLYASANPNHTERGSPPALSLRRLLGQPWHFPHHRIMFIYNPTHSAHTRLIAIRIVYELRCGVGSADALHRRLVACLLAGCLADWLWHSALE